MVNILTEECDRGLDNGQENSPCSSNCLLNGSNQAYGSLCGNGIIETGENCDDGNINNNDGCSNKCLKESGRPNGSMRNVPVCGNGNVEFGEDCDEGAKNSATGSGCSDKCLSTGSILGQAFCGNGIVQKKAFDSFSWLIQPTDQLPIDVNTSRCPNSIWQVTLKQEMASSTVYICQQKNQLASDGNIWQRIWSGVKYFFSSLVPKARANTGNVVDACGEGYTLMASNAVVEANSFAEIIQNRYGADGIRYTYIKQGDWQMNSNYKIVVYSANNPFAKASSTPDYVTTVGPIYNNYNQCRIVDVRADIWPLGESKNRDTFFCYGDNCGKATESLYDDDMNASWNISHYPFVSSVPNNAPGNQHLYFAFAQNSKGDLLKSNVSWNLSNPSRVNLAELNMGGLPYGNTWVTAKQEPGYTQLVVNVDGGSRDNEPIGLASTTVMIQVFPCTYPWPSPEQFPFIDNGSNCKNTNASCLNTNFETYYCLGDNRVDGLLPGLATSTILSRLDGSVGNDILKEFLFYRDDIVGTSTTKFGVATSTNADAVGIRVINNASHLDPVSWYGGYFPTTKQGNPVSVNIDGYRGIIDGRTFYVSAADLDYAENGVKKIYSDIYLMSYNADADAVTQNIYRQLFNNMRFNSATSSDPDFKNGGLIFKLGTCSSDVNYDCLLDSDCLSVGKGYCLSDKAKLTRDTARLADINKVSSTLAVYYSIKRCGNELNRLCSDSSQCFGSGVCGNYYPDIKSGSYVAGCSVSTWPSWQGTLGNVLGGNLPVDPINKMFGCDTLNGFDANTCWNEQSKQVQHFIVNNTTSTVYYYMASTTNYQLSAKNEFDYGVGVNPWSWWKKINTNNVSDVFGGFNITSMCAINRCNTVDAVNDCSCPQYKASGKTCGSNKTCVLDSGDGKYKCSCIDADGDGYPDVSCNNILQVNPLINSGVQNFIPMQNNFNLGTPINSLNQNPIQGPIMGPIQ